MADRDTALEKRDAVPSKTTPSKDKGSAKPDPDTLVVEIEQTREELARTIDAIADRVSPANVARRTVDKARQRVVSADPRVIGAGALLAVGVAAYLVLRRRRR
jgi:uncharacterized protein (TIGR03382 family)